MAEPKKPRDPMEVLDKPQRDILALMDEVLAKLATLFE